MTDSIGLFSGTALGLYGLSGLGMAGMAAGGKLLLESQQWALGGTMIGVFGCLTLYAMAQVSRRYETAEPNEWMLVIENGECKRSSVGLVHFRSIGQSIVKFPSKMFSLEYSAMQVTKEMQGVKVTGFANWSIYRNEDGPYKAYKTFDGFTNQGCKDANSNVRKLVEAVLRHAVSGMTIEDVMTKRNEIRNHAKEEVDKITKGWGIWIETIEITDVVIMSKKLFTNMQAEHRQAMRLKAEKINMKTELELAEDRRENDVAMQKAQQEAQTQKFEVETQQKLLREQREFETKAEQHKLRLKQIEQQQELEVSQLNMRSTVNMATLKQKQELDSARKANEREQEALDLAQERQMRELDLSLENNMSPLNLKMRMLGILEGATQRVNYDMKVVNMGKMDNLEQMIPGMGAIFKETMSAVDV